MSESRRPVLSLLVWLPLLLAGCLAGEQQEVSTPVEVQALTASPPPPPPLFYREVSEGDAYSLMLAELQVEQRRDAIRLLNGYLPARRLRPGLRYAYRLREGGGLDSLLFHYRPESLLVITPAAEGLRAATLALPGRSEWWLYEGELRGNLYESMVAAGVPLEAVISYTDIFQWDVDFFVDCRNGDRWSLLLEKRFLKSGGEWRLQLYGPLRWATYSQADTTFTAWRFEPEPDRAGYFTSAGEPFAKTFLKSPLNYRRISSHFSRGRFHPILRKVRPHNGVDFSAAYGTPVVASGNGRVVKLAFQRRGMGRYVKIQHANRRYATLYGHLSGYAPGLREGQRVKQNQLIGYVGTTGLTTGPHLHYTFLVDGKAIDPLRIPNPGLEPLAGEVLTRLAAAVARTDSLLGCSQMLLPSAPASPASLATLTSGDASRSDP